MTKRKINILICETSFEKGGAEIQTYNVISRLNRDKYNVILCTFYNPGVLGERLRTEGYTVYSNLISNKFDIRIYIALRQIIINERIDLLYVINQPLTLFWGMLIAKTASIPIIVAIHNTMDTSTQFKLRIYKVLLPLADKIIAVAETQGRHLILNEKIPEELICVIPNGIDLDKFCNKTPEVNGRIGSAISRGFMIVGIVTRLYPVKGIDIFLNCAKLLHDSLENVLFIIVGDGPEMKTLKELACNLGIQDSVIFLGVRNDIEKILPLFDVAVLCSRSEALPLVALEYMASMRPVVSTNVGSLSDVVKDGVNGFLVESGRTDLIAEKILQLLFNEKMRLQMGYEGRKLIEERFSIEKAVEKTDRLIQKIVEN